MLISLTPSAPSSGLISLDRALLEPALADLNSSNAPAVAAVIEAASRAIERVCKRVFSAQDYVLHLSIGPRTCDWIALPNFPVISITRLACGPKAALCISNTDGTNNQRATVLTTTTPALRLTTTSAGVSSSIDLTLSSLPTIGSLATAITAAGSGWTATAIDPLANLPSSDLRSLTAALPALNRSACLEAFTEDLPPWQSAQSVWSWAGDASGAATGWQLDPDAGLIVGRFADSLDGPMHLRCEYRAGFEVIPGDIQQACARLAALIAEDGQRNSAVLQQTVGPYTQKFDGSASKLIKNAAVIELIHPYIDHAKTVGHLWP